MINLKKLYENNNPILQGLPQLSQQAAQLPHPPACRKYGSIQLAATTPTAMNEITEAITLLRSRGFSVTHPEASDWITPIDLWRVHGEGVTLASFRDRLTHPRCPQYQRHIGAKGRTTTLRPTPDLIDFLRQPPQPGRRLG
jgi:hypothetical protein